MKAMAKRFFRKTFRFFDKLEDRIRIKLSHKPILYAFIGGFGVVLFWRGAWISIDYIVERIHHTGILDSRTDSFLGIPWWDGPLSLLLGSVLLLATGNFVFNFIGSELIVTGLSGEKKLTEKTEDEVRAELELLKELEHDVHDISNRLEKFEEQNR
jgi:hypothetical protein